MSVHSGKFGTINGIPTVRVWSVNDDQALAKGVASNTSFGPFRRKGVEEWNGNFTQYGKQPTVMPGAAFNFVGYTAPDNDAGGNGIKYAGVAYSKQVTIVWNFSGGEMINIATDFDGHLNLTTQGVSGAVVLDNSTPVIPPIVDGKVQYSTDGVTWLDWIDVSQATLTIMNEIQEYVDSSTIVADTGVNHLWKGRKAGNMDATLSVVENNTDRSRFKKGDDLAIRLYVDTSLFYEAFWFQVEKVSSIQVDRESGKIIQQTVNLGFNGVKTSDASAGHIKLPDTTTWWPVAQT